MWRRALRSLLWASMAALVAAAPAAAADDLRAGAGRADITPPTGYFMMGWVRSDARTTGQHTRLFARVLVLERGDRKLALVAEDLGAIPGGMLAQAADMVRDRGFSERNVIASASHTHAAPTGFYNFGAYNTVFPTLGTPTSFNTAVDPQLYSFMVRQLALAIRRADDDLGPAAAGWGSARLEGLTRNRSIEAHLANHGIEREFGQGSVELDPGGYAHTIDPEVNVLRVDKLSGSRRVPIGMWSTFADHGTVNKYTFHYYNADHHGSATRVVEDELRRLGAVPPAQEVVNAYGNTDEGDISAGLDRGGPAASDFVGREEARQMLAAWREAGGRMTRRPALDLRWTRVCFCGQQTSGGRVDSQAVIGLPLLTGSEEGRGPLFDITGVPLEGRRLLLGTEPQGHKIPFFTDATGSTPRAVPLLAARVADRMIVTVPGEMTAEMGRRLRESVVRASAAAGIAGATIAGLANEYLQYFTTPEEYDRQHYEGGSMLYGRAASNLVEAELSELARRLVGGEAAQPAYPFDPTNGLEPSAAPFEPGASRGEIVGQPRGSRRLEPATFSWRGGPRGLDRPLDRAFVTIERQEVVPSQVRRPRRGVPRRRAPRRRAPAFTGATRWRSVDSDLGLRILWSVDDEGVYSARWESPLDAPAGLYRFVVRANRYRLASAPFRLAPSGALSLQPAGYAGGRLRLTLGYPAAVPERDLTHRPPRARGGELRATVGGRTTVVRQSGGEVFSVAVAPGVPVTVAAGAARDRFGNSNAEAVRLTP